MYCLIQSTLGDVLFKPNICGDKHNCLVLIRTSNIFTAITFSLPTSKLSFNSCIYLSCSLVQFSFIVS